MTLDEYQNKATDTAIYPGQGTALGMVYCALKLNGEAGELAEHIGKAIRDDDFLYVYRDESGFSCADVEHPLRAKRQDLVVKEVGDCLWYLANICNELDIDLSDAAEINLEKLASRKERNVLQGSGDNR